MNRVLFLKQISTLIEFLRCLFATSHVLRLRSSFFLLRYQVVRIERPMNWKIAFTGLCDWWAFSSRFSPLSLSFYVLQAFPFKCEMRKRSFCHAAWGLLKKVFILCFVELNLLSGMICRWFSFYNFVNETFQKFVKQIVMNGRQGRRRIVNRDEEEKVHWAQQEK